MQTDYFNPHIHFRCNMFGNMFKQSLKDGLDSKTFIKDVMTNKNYDFMFITYACQEWSDDAFMYSVIKNKTKCKKGKTLDSYILWFAGYLYRYWMETRNMDRKDIYKILPIEKLLNGFDFYHTQDWDYIINDVSNNEKG